MPLDPRLRPVLALMNRGADDNATVPMAVKRGVVARQARALGPLVMRGGPDVHATEHELVPVEGGQILVRVYRPTAGRVLPLHVFIHGGGWCTGTLDERDNRCREIAVGAGCVVASVDYRMAPENAFPTPGEDCYAALCWLVEHAERLGIDPGRVSVGGESAGANLAAVLTLMARDRSGPSLVFQWLDVPSTDLTMSQPSIERLGTGYALTKQSMDDYVAAYLRDVDPTEPYASPLHADDLSGLPPALIMTAELDPLRDDGLAYARRLREAGVPVETHDLPGLIHASFALTRLLPTARAYQDDAIAALRRAYAPA